ncbi:MAG: hypothetical protein CL912_08630 [Deltaproteobacteria bacterium]|nr:hypothetical protein [Deltaproteobacteria bacterium]
MPSTEPPKRSGRKSTSRHAIKYIDREYGPLTAEALHHPQRDEVKQHKVRLLDRYMDEDTLAPVQEKLFVDSMKSCGNGTMKWRKVSRSRYVRLQL